MATIQFLGAAGTVTGSKFLLEHAGTHILIDCGLFQGSKELRLRNWKPFPLPPSKIDAVVLTHAHIDHTGSLPRLVREGFKGPVYCTHGTRDLSGLMLPDSARLQEEEAYYANKKGYGKHRPSLPLYTEKDALHALKHFESFGYDRPKKIAPDITLRFVRAGHILGSAICIFDLTSTQQRVVFSGDLGRYNAPILKDPEAVDFATTLIVESTYGDRTHGETASKDNLADAVNAALSQGGVAVIPAFAIGRTQEVLYDLRLLENEKRIPEVPVYVDSPMACDATPLYLAHREDHDVDISNIIESGASPFTTRHTIFARSMQQSRAINDLKGPGIIISAAGMATGGRVLHHLQQRLPHAQNSVLFVGYQAFGTRGRRLVDGEKEIKIHGQMVPVRARIFQISGFSAHADWQESLRWMNGFKTPPKQTMLVHGEPAALEAMKTRVQNLGWNATIPKDGETVELAGSK